VDTPSQFQMLAKQWKPSKYVIDWMESGLHGWFNSEKHCLNSWSIHLLVSTLQKLTISF